MFFEKPSDQDLKDFNQISSSPMKNWSDKANTSNLKEDEPAPGKVYEMKVLKEMDYKEQED